MLGLPAEVSPEAEGLTTTTDRAAQGDVVECACRCGGTLKEFDAEGRQRKYINGHNIRALWRAMKTATK